MVLCGLNNQECTEGLCGKYVLMGNFCPNRKFLSNSYDLQSGYAETHRRKHNVNKTKM